MARDLQTITDLEQHEKNIVTAQGDEAKAEAMYQMASYLYESNSLLFYNPVGGILTDDVVYRAPNEVEIAWQYAQEHEPAAQAIKIYLETARLYPNTRAGREALYTAAVCHERLANYNEYWRMNYGYGRHAGNRMVTYRDWRAAYPNYIMPLGTDRWQPSTRTVNGRHGYPAKPKPKKFTRWQRFEARYNKVKNFFWPSIAATIASTWHWFWGLVYSWLSWFFSWLFWWWALGAVVIAWRMAAKAERKILTELRACRRLPRALLGTGNEAWPSADEIITLYSGLPFRLRDEWIAAFQQVRYEGWWRLRCTRDGLIFSLRVFTHGAFVVLLLAMLGFF